MFKVEKDRMGRYRISIGAGKIYRARDISEVQTALAHYFRDGNYCFSGNNLDCPLCRAIGEGDD